MSTSDLEEPYYEFWFIHGPFLGALRRLHLTRPDGTPRGVLLAAIAWVPFFIGGLLQVVVAHQSVPILFDPTVHVRLLIAIPLVISGERVFASRCGHAIKQLYDGHYADERKLDQVIERATRMRDARAPMIVIGAIAIVFGQVTLWGYVDPIVQFSGADEAGAFSFARVWYALVGQPLTVFLLARWLWQWALWSYVVIKISRLKLATIAAHPDHAAGLAVIGGPIAGFSVLVMALASVVATTWATDILETGATLQSFIPGFVVLVISAVVVACGPYFAYTPVLYRERLRSLRQYNALSLHYIREFESRWFAQPRDTNRLLGAPDIQSLNDLIGAYDSMASVRLVPFGRRLVLALWAAAAIPMIPLAVVTTPIDVVFARLGKMLIGFVA